MMNVQLSPQEWQTLSAYLDGQLSERERRQVEMRLQTRPEYRSGLEELRRTRAILRSLPQRRAPRNFTLSPALAEQIRPSRRRQPRAGFALRYVSAFASFLLVLTFFGDIALRANQQTLLANDAMSNQTVYSATLEPAAAGQVQFAPQARVVLATEPLPTTPPEPTDTTVAQESAGVDLQSVPEMPVPAPEGALAMDSLPQPTQPGIDEPAADETITSGSDSGDSLGEPMMGMMSVQDTPTETPTGAGQDQMTPEGAGGGGNEVYTMPAQPLLPTPMPPQIEQPPAIQVTDTPSGEGLTILPPADNGVAPKAGFPVEEPQSPQSQTVRQDWSHLLRPAEILLAVIAVASALAAFILFWKNRV